MGDLTLRTRGCFRYIFHESKEKKGWTNALLILTGNQQNASIVADLQDTDYEALDMPESKITMPLKQFRVCRKRGSYSLDRAAPSVVTTNASLRPSDEAHCSPAYQIHLSSRILFAKRHLWIGFNNVHDLDTWYPVVRGLVTKRFKIPANTEPLETSPVCSGYGSSHTSELDLLALALPSMHENDIYESAIERENFSVVVVQTEKSRELGLVGRFTLRLTPTSFQLLDPVSHTMRQIWPIRYVRKFGVHMKRFYLISGSGCDTGRGLFIFYVPEAANLQHKLLNLTQQLSVQSTLARRVTQPHLPMKCQSPQGNSLSEMIPNTDYWFQSEPVRKTALTSPSLTTKTGSMLGPRLGSSPTLHMPASPICKQSVPLVYESDRRSQSSSKLSFEEKMVDGRRYTNRSSQTWYQDGRTASSPHLGMGKARDSPNSPVYLARRVVNAQVTATDAVPDADPDRINSQPLYANVDQFAEMPSKEGDDCGISPSVTRKPWEKGFTALHSTHVLDDQDSDSSEEIETRRWRITSVFEPIDEKDEHTLASSSGSLMETEIPEPSSRYTETNNQPVHRTVSIEDHNQLVSSSTPGDDVPFDETELDSLETVPKPNLPTRTVDQRLFRRPAVANFRKCVTRSATWDGWMCGVQKPVVGKSYAAADASIQTETEHDSTESGSDIIIVRTAL